MSLDEALTSFPQRLRQGLDIAYGEGGAMAREMLERGDMPPARALLAGLSLNPTARDLMEDAFDSEARIFEELPQNVPEVVIGDGAHAAIYATVRKQIGAPPPLVLGANERFGGTFAMTRRSSFYLNSRNRPGPLGAPGSKDALNVIPGAMMQPSDLGGSEYQANADLGLVVRCSLTLNAVVRQGRVQGIETNGNQLIVVTERGLVRTGRVIVATGIGQRRTFNGYPPDNKRVFSYEQFLQRFDRLVFPLRGLGRVAVVGAGDSGKTIVEALTGYGPYMGGSVASMDYVDRIDWYGAEGIATTKERWLECNRTRYKPLAALFPKADGSSRNARVRSLPQARQIVDAYDALLINGEAYDTVIDCRGFIKDKTWRDFVGLNSDYEVGVLRSNPDGEKGLQLARVNAAQNLYVVGPAADLDYESQEQFQTVENKVSLFRLAPRTAAVATRLPLPNALN